MTPAGLRILLIVLNRAGQGTYWRAFHFGRCLRARGHAVTLLATAPVERLRVMAQVVDDVQVVAMPDLLPGALRSGWDPWAVARRLAWLRGRRFDVVHAFESRPVVIYPALAARRAGAKLVMDWCDWFGRGGSVEERPSAWMRAVLRPVETYYEEHFRRRADATTVINRFLAERAASLGVSRESILLLRNGTDTSQPVMARDAARRLVGLAESGPLLGFVGGIFTRDAELMARAFERLLLDCPDLRLLLVGHFNRDLEGMLGSSRGVLRTGPVSPEQLVAYLAAANVGWLPLRDSGANRGRWPMKLGDYMRAGLPTVSTAVGELADFVTRFGLGVAAPDEPEAFAAATLELLRDEERQSELGRAARRAAEGELSWETLTGQLEAAYARALGA